MVTNMLKNMLFVCILLLTIVSTVQAQAIQTYDCDELFNGTVLPKTTFDEYANICIYGSGYQGAQDLILSNDQNTYEITVEAKNGILSSLTGLQSFFDDVAHGVYQLMVKGLNTYAKDIIVTGEDEPTPLPEEVPEFSTIAALFALIGAGFYMKKVRP